MSRRLLPHRFPDVSFPGHLFQVTVTADVDAVFFGGRDYHLAGLVPAFWQPGEHYCTSREHLGPFGLRFLSILGDLRDFILEVFLKHLTNIFCLFPAYFFCDVLSESGREDVEKQRFVEENNLSQKSAFQLLCLLSWRLLFVLSK